MALKIYNICFSAKPRGRGNAAVFGRAEGEPAH